MSAPLHITSHRAPQRRGRIWALRPDMVSDYDDVLWELALHPDALVRYGDDLTELRRAYLATALTYDLSPGVLPCAYGDTLLCGCAPGTGQRGRCHRGWAAWLLVRAGWSVVLDGVPVAADAVMFNGVTYAPGPGMERRLVESMG